MASLDHVQAYQSHNIPQLPQCVQRLSTVHNANEVCEARVVAEIHNITLTSSAREMYNAGMEKLEINEQGEIVGTKREKYFTAPREQDLRRKPRGQRKTFEVGQMWDLHHEITRRILLGQKNVDIARALHISEATVSYTRNSKIVQSQLSMMQAARDADSIDLARDIREKAPKALSLLEQIIDDPAKEIPISLRAKTAESWMDRAGYAAPKRVEAIVAHLTAEEIERIKKEAVADAEASSILVEGEVVEAGQG